MKIIRLTMATAGVFCLGTCFLGLLLGLIHPVLGLGALALAVWAIFYATAHVDI